MTILEAKQEMRQALRTADRRTLDTTLARLDRQFGSLDAEMDSLLFRAAKRLDQPLENFEA